MTLWSRYLKLPLIAALVIIVMVLFTGCIFPQDTVTGPQKIPTGSGPQISSPATESPAPVIPPANAVTTPTGSGFLKYSNSLYGFSIDYPADWEKSETNTYTGPEGPGIRIVGFSSPSEYRCRNDTLHACPVPPCQYCSNIRAEVNVHVDSSPFTRDPVEYYTKDVARIAANGDVEFTQKEVIVTQSGIKEYAFDYYYYMVDQYRINVLRAYTVVGDRGYIITYHARAPKNEWTKYQFKEYYRDVRHMLESFSVTG